MTKIYPQLKKKWVERNPQKRTQIRPQKIYRSGKIKTESYNLFLKQRPTP